MNTSSPINTTASSLPARKITRQQLAAHCGLSVRKIDQLTSTGVLGHYKIGGAVRYDLAEVEATLRERFHVQPTAPMQALGKADASFNEGRVETHGGGGLRTSRPTSSRPTAAKACAGPARGRAGCPQPAASKPLTHAEETRPLETPQSPLSPAAIPSSTTALHPQPRA